MSYQIMCQLLIDSGSLNNTLNNTHNDTVTCHDDFQWINSTCILRCDKFSEYPQHITNVILGVELLAGVLGLIVCVIIVIAAVCDYKTL